MIQYQHRNSPSDCNPIPPSQPRSASIGLRNVGFRNAHPKLCASWLCVFCTSAADRTSICLSILKHARTAPCAIWKCKKNKNLRGKSQGTRYVLKQIHVGASKYQVFHDCDASFVDFSRHKGQGFAMSVSHCLPARSWTSFIWTCQHLRTHLQGAVMRRKPSGRRSPMAGDWIGVAVSAFLWQEFENFVLKLGLFYGVSLVTGLTSWCLSWPWAAVTPWYLLWCWPQSTDAISGDEHVLNMDSSQLSWFIIGLGQKSKPIPITRFNYHVLGGWTDEHESQLFSSSPGLGFDMFWPKTTWKPPSWSQDVALSDLPLSLRSTVQVDPAASWQFSVWGGMWWFISGFGI